MITAITEATYEQEIRDHAGKILIDFYTPTCPPCRAMAPVLEEIALEQGDALKIVKVDASEESGLAARFNVRAVPTFVLLHGPKDPAQIVGARSKKDFLQWIAAN